MTGVVLLVVRFLLAAALYAFLGFALWVLWKDLRQSSQSAGQSLVLPLTLVLADQDEPGRRFTIPEVLIGRDPACAYALDELTISLRHARLFFRASQWWVEDLGSRNGTFLNQAPVASPLVIASGDQLRCGQVIFDLSIEEHS